MTPTGWVCPVCSDVNAPWLEKCGCLPLQIQNDPEWSSTCCECGQKMEEVRPGKHQCAFCENREAGYVWVRAAGVERVLKRATQHPLVESEEEHEEMVELARILKEHRELVADEATE